LKSTRSSSAARRAPKRPSGYPRWAVAAVVVVGLGLVAAAVRVATLDPPRARATAAEALVPERAPDPLPTPRPRPPAPRPPAPRPAPRPPEPEPAPEPAPPAPAHATTWVRGASEKVRVAKVLDGDSFETADGRRVRLIGVETPDGQGAQAAALLRELVGGREVTLELDEERSDRWQRTLAWVHAGDLFVNGELVRRGVSWCAFWAPNVAHQDELVAWQKQARTARLGVWGAAAPASAGRCVAVRGQPRFHRPECELARKAEPARKVELAGRDAALDEGWAPCGECGP
jgi:endonuclease YncB( thermonuclease family)